MKVLLAITHDSQTCNRHFTCCFRQLLLPRGSLARNSCRVLRRSIPHSRQLPAALDRSRWTAEMLEVWTRRAVVLVDKADVSNVLVSIQCTRKKNLYIYLYICGTVCLAVGYQEKLLPVLFSIERHIRQRRTDVR